MERWIVVGDIHGCIHTMHDLLTKVSYEGTSDNIIFIGDYIDRGYYSYEVVSAIRKMEQQFGKDKVICLRGNHEQMAIDAYRKGRFKFWYRYGGMLTEKSFEQNGKTLDEAITWFETLLFAYDKPDTIFCHAGLTRPTLKDNSSDDLIWGRDWIETDTRPREKQVVFGHTPTRAFEAYTTKTGDICIDAGCVYGGQLCAFVVQEDGMGELVYVPKAKEDK